jgi:hypothetical protein
MPSTDFWDCVTTADMAFVYTLLQWGVKKWVAGDVLQRHRQKESKIIKKTAEVTVKKEYNGFDYDDNEDDDELNLNNSDKCPSLTDDRQSGDDDDEDNDDKKPKRSNPRGRKKNTTSFGGDDNVDVYCSHGQRLESILYSWEKEKVAETWTEEAMRLVNKERVGVLSDDDDDDNDHYGKKKAKKAHRSSLKRDTSRIGRRFDRCLKVYRLNEEKRLEERKRY